MQTYTIATYFLFFRKCSSSFLQGAIPRAFASLFRSHYLIMFARQALFRVFWCYSCGQDDRNVSPLAEAFFVQLVYTSGTSWPRLWKMAAMSGRSVWPTDADEKKKDCPPSATPKQRRRAAPLANYLHNCPWVLIHGCFLSRRGIIVPCLLSRSSFRNDGSNLIPSGFWTIRIIKVFSIITIWM